jgi:hypothetical protein
MKLIRMNALCAALSFAAAGLNAQTINTSLSVGNAYVWRGVTLSDQTVVQGELSLGLPMAGGTFTAGAWGSAEVDPDSTRFSSLTDFESGVGEVDLYAQFAHAAGPAMLTLGVTALRFPEISDWNTFEVFGIAALPNAPLAPSLTLRKDVDAVGGLYAEANVSQSFPVAPGHALVLAGMLGASTGQADDGDLAWYADEGITHLMLSASTGFAAGGFTVTPLVGVVYGVDDFTKVDDEELRWAASLTVSRSFPLKR